MGEVAQLSAVAGEGREDLEHVEAAVAFINERTAESGVRLAREVGEYVLAAFFGGDFERFRDSRRNKSLSFRCLLARQDLLLPPTTIYTFVRVARQLVGLPAEAAACLSLSHHRALLPVQDEQEKAALATRAAAEGWSKLDLERRVRARESQSPRGRKRLPVYVKATSRIARVLDDALGEGAAPGELRGVGEKRLRKTLEQIEQSLIRLQWLKATVEEALAE